jgi:hypothetical protein
MRRISSILRGLELTMERKKFSMMNSWWWIVTSLSPLSYRLWMK